MYFDTKSYLKSNYYHTVKHALSVLWNKTSLEKFLLARESVKGDPLSLYILVLCLEHLSQLIHREVSLGKNHSRLVEKVNKFPIYALQMICYCLRKQMRGNRKVIKNIFLTRHGKCKINSDRKNES